MTPLETGEALSVKNLQPLVAGWPPAGWDMAAGGN